MIDHAVQCIVRGLSVTYVHCTVLLAAFTDISACSYTGKSYSIMHCA